MAIIESGTCKIDSLNHKGLGVGKTIRGKIELPYTLPGELVEFERHEYRGQENTILKKIIEASAERIIPACKYFGICGGCALQHLSSGAYEKFKRNLISDALRANNISAEIYPIIIIPAAERRRANLEFSKKNEQVFLGFCRFRSNQIVNIDSCPVLLPSLSSLIEPLKHLFSQILSDNQKGEIYLTQASKGIDLLLDSSCGLSKAAEERISEFAEEYNIVRFAIRQNSEIIYLYERSKPYIIFDEVPVEVTADGFLQASFASDKILTEILLENLAPKKTDLALDLFSGRGTYTLPLSRYCNVAAIDSDASALAALDKASKLSKRAIQITMRNLFSAPLVQEELNKYDICVLNPPRIGAGRQCKNLAKSNIGKICYISCNPRSFAEDAARLIDGGYKLEAVIPVDQFYWSAHIELVGVFSRI